jgi:STE24 endopeptidase
MSQERPTLNVPAGAEWKPGFDPVKATDAWIATVPAADRAKSDAYFEGGYWMDFAGTLIALLVAWLLLASRASSRWRDRCEAKFRRPFPAAWLYGAGFVLAWAILTLPWDFYTGYVREHRFGRTSTSRVSWATGPRGWASTWSSSRLRSRASTPSFAAWAGAGSSGAPR